MTNRVPKAYIYARLSKNDVMMRCKSCRNLVTISNPFSEERKCGYCGTSRTEEGSPDGILRQTEKVVEYYNDRLAHKAELDQHVYWEVVGSHTRPFHQRKEGAKIINSLQAGDHLLVYDLDRGWRSTGEFYETLWRVRNRDASLHLVNRGIDMGNCDPQTKAMVGMMAIFAEWEWDICSDRARKQKKWAKDNGIPVNQYAGYGYKHICAECGHDLPQHGRECPGCGVFRTGRNKVTVPDEQDRSLLLWIYHTKQTHTWKQLVSAANREGITANGGKQLTERSAQRRYAAAQKMMQNGELPKPA